MSKASIISLCNMVFLLALILLYWQGTLAFVPLWSYQTHKLLHILGVCMFVGNVFVGPVWVLKALQSQRAETVKFAFSLLLFTDMLITIPGMQLTVINGLYMTTALGGLSQNDWLMHAVFGLFALWLLVIPILFIQDKMHELSQMKEYASNKFKKWLFAWIVVGAISLLPVVFVFMKMVYKG